MWTSRPVIRTRNEMDRLSRFLVVFVLHDTAIYIVMMRFVLTPSQYESFKRDVLFWYVSLVDLKPLLSRLINML